jgi:hypothetical protein
MTREIREFAVFRWATGRPSTAAGHQIKSGAAGVGSRARSPELMPSHTTAAKGKSKERWSSVSSWNLHPKVDGAVVVKDFRPISLFHSFGKHVAKLLATRLAPRMSELVHANQSAFIKERYIQDNFVLVQ